MSAEKFFRNRPETPAPAYSRGQTAKSQGSNGQVVQYADESEKRIAAGLARKRSRVYHKGFCKLEGVLEQALARHGLAGRLEQYQFVRFWPEIVGPEGCKRCRPLMVKGATLFVEVRDAAWVQELSFHKQVLLSRIKQHYQGQPAITEIVFRVEGQSSGYQGNASRDTSSRGNTSRGFAGASSKR